MDDWQPIESAPKDGRWLLVFIWWADGAEDNWRVVQWSKGRWRRPDGSGTLGREVSPVAWHRLTAPELCEE